MFALQLVMVCPWFCGSIMFHCDAYPANHRITAEESIMASGFVNDGGGTETMGPVLRWDSALLTPVVNYGRNLAKPRGWYNHGPA